MTGPVFVLPCGARPTSSSPLLTSPAGRLGRRTAMHPASLSFLPLATRQLGNGVAFLAAYEVFLRPLLLLPALPHCLGGQRRGRPGAPHMARARPGRGATLHQQRAGGQQLGGVPSWCRLYLKQCVARAAQLCVTGSGASTKSLLSRPLFLPFAAHRQLLAAALRHVHRHWRHGGGREDDGQGQRDHRGGGHGYCVET
jgi:hypothetical protein